MLFFSSCLFTSTYVIYEKVAKLYQHFFVREEISLDFTFTICIAVVVVFGWTIPLKPPSVVLYIIITPIIFHSASPSEMSWVLHS